MQVAAARHCPRAIYGRRQLVTRARPLGLRVVCKAQAFQGTLSGRSIVAAALVNLLAVQPVIAAVEEAVTPIESNLDLKVLLPLTVFMTGAFLTAVWLLFSGMDPDSFENSDSNAIGKGTNYDDGSGFNF